MFGFEVDASALTKTVETLGKLPERVQTAAGHTVQKQIRQHSQEYMQSPDGVTFAPLTDKYRKRKVKSGRPGLPNLTFTGELMRDIKPRKEGDEIFIAPKESDLAKAEGLSKKRPFIGLAPETPGLIEQAMVVAFEDMFR